MNLNPIHQMQGLAARQNLHFLSATQDSDNNSWTLYALDRLKKLVCVWAVAFDLDDEMMVGTELLCFDPDHTGDIPECILVDAKLWEEWETEMKSDDNPYGSYQAAMKRKGK